MNSTIQKEAETLVNKTNNFIPTQSIKDWRNALKALTETAYSNYSQTGLEGATVEEEVLDEWVRDNEEKIEETVKVMDGDYNKALTIINEIITFSDTYYEIKVFQYRDQSENISEWKKNNIVGRKVSFGIEEEDYYEAHIYNGPTSLEKYARVLAKYSDCSDKF